MQRIFRASIVVALLALSGSPSLQAADAVWIEAEAATANVKPNIAGWGNKSILSGEKWLHFSVDADKVNQDVPADGATFLYQFTIGDDGNFEVWNRLGFEFVRTPF